VTGQKGESAIGLKEQGGGPVSEGETESLEECKNKEGKDLDNSPSSKERAIHCYQD